MFCRAVGRAGGSSAGIEEGGSRCKVVGSRVWGRGKRTEGWRRRSGVEGENAGGAEEGLLSGENAVGGDGGADGRC